MSENKTNEHDDKIGRLLGNIGRLHSTRADRLVEKLGLFRGQAILLMILSDHEGLTHSEIAEILEISPAAATKVIKRMEALNYLQRQSDPADERISRVFLKEDGLAVVRQIRSAFEQIDQILLTGFAPQEKDTLIQLLQRVRANLANVPFDPD
jgi:DNA-binding MarR family transcriptional regulator